MGIYWVTFAPKSSTLDGYSLTKNDFIMSLFAALKEILDESTIEEIAKLNNEKPEKLQKVVDALAVALTGGLLKRVSNEYGMNLVFGQVSKADLQANQLKILLQNPTEWDSFLANGDKVFHTLLPSIKSPIAAVVAKYAGTRNSLVSSLCGLIGPVVLSALHKQVNTQKLDAKGLSAYLGDQREALLQVAPDLNPALIETLGIQSLLENFVVPQVEPSAVVRPFEAKSAQAFLTNSVEEPTPTDFKPYLKWFGILALVAAIVAGGVYFWNQRDQNTVTAEEEIDSVATGSSEARTVTEPPVKDSVAKVVPATTSKTDSLNPMRTYLTDAGAKMGKAFKFQNVDFEDHTPQLKTTAQAPVQGLAALLKENPTAEIKLIGYANDALPPMTNKMLSVKRVYALKQKLIDAGIGFLRVDAEGVGNGVVLKDSTRRNRTPLREIYVKFVKK